MTETIQATSQIQHSSWIELRANHLLENLETLRHASGQSEVLAVIEANAYGHGLADIAKTLAGKVTYFGVATLREALELKEHYPQTPVFLFGHLFSHEIPAALLGGITLSVSSSEKAREISDISENLGRKTSVHIKIDTGMGRMGIPTRDALPAIEQMSRMKGLMLDGIYTHLPTAEKQDAFRESQVREYGLLLHALEQKGIVFRYRHISNSAASLTLKTPLVNMIRPGLSLYGIHSAPELKEAASLQPVLSLKSRIALVKKILPGESVGYGRKFIAKTATTVATIPLGYSHGYPYTAWKKACVIYQGKRYPLAGKISMDYMTFNLGHNEVKEGNIVTLIGQDGNDCIHAEEIATWARTIPYEIVTRLNNHLPRMVI